MGKVEIQTARQQLDELVTTASLLSRYVLDVKLDANGRNAAMAYLTECLLMHAMEIETALGGQLINVQPSASTVESRCDAH